MVQVIFANTTVYSRDADLSFKKDCPLSSNH